MWATAFVLVAVACGSPTLALSGPGGIIEGIRSSACTRTLVFTQCQDATPREPAVASLRGPTGVDLSIQASPAPDEIQVEIDRGPWDSRQPIERRALRSRDETVHLAPSVDPYYIVVAVRSGGSSATAVFGVKVSP